MDPALSHTASALSPRSLLPLPPRVAPATTPSQQQLLADMVLQSLFNAPSCAETHLGADPLPGAVIAALYSRVVAGRDFSTLHADQDTLLQVLLESNALGPTQPRYRLSSCSIGKALNIICLMWRERERTPADIQRLVALVESCAPLIRRPGSILLETCGVIMFHLGELITCRALSALCGRLICDHLEPMFRAAIRSRLHEPLAGAEVAFGLISTLRASEQRLLTAAIAPSQRTAADALITTVHMLLDRQPDFLLRCESTTLGLIARHSALYLRQLAAVQGKNADAADKDRQFSAARLVRSCIDEVRSRPCDGGEGAHRPPPGYDSCLRYAPPYYEQWLSRQEPYVRAWLALRVGDDVPVQHEAVAVEAELCRARNTDAGSPLARLTEAADALAERGEGASRAAREEAIARADAVMATPPVLHVGLRARAQMLLDMDTVFQHLNQADPPAAPRYDGTLETLRVFLQEQASDLVDARGTPLLGPAVPLHSGLRSWQRLLLAQLLT